MNQSKACLGVLGGYCAYDHQVCCRLLPLRDMLFWAKRLTPHLAARNLRARVSQLGESVSEGVSEFSERFSE